MTRPHITGEPQERLTRIGDRMAASLAGDPEHMDGDKAIVMLHDGQRFGIVVDGYDSDEDATSDLFGHLRDIFEASGKILTIMPLSHRGQG